MTRNVIQLSSQCGSGFNLDGRRALVAYRRYVNELLWMRMVRREDVGEAGGANGISYIDHELETAECLIRRDAPAFLAGPEEVPPCFHGRILSLSSFFFSKCVGVSSCSSST